LRCAGFRAPLRCAKMQATASLADGFGGGRCVAVQAAARWLTQSVPSGPTPRAAPPTRPSGPRARLRVVLEDVQCLEHVKPKVARHHQRVAQQLRDRRHRARGVEPGAAGSGLGVLTHSRTGHSWTDGAACKNVPDSLTAATRIPRAAADPGSRVRSSYPTKRWSRKNAAPSAVQVLRCGMSPIVLCQTWRKASRRRACERAAARALPGPARWHYM